MKEPLICEDIVQAFRKVGLETGESLVVHSSFRSIGPVAGGPETVIRALLDVIGPEGNLMFPTFNGPSTAQPYFDPDKTPSRTGIIPEMGRNFPGAVRSLHPTHSVAVIGPDAEMLTRGHLDCRAVGVDSPLDRLAKMGGKILMIGVMNNSNTTVHVGEEHAGALKVVPFFNIPSIKVRLPDGRIISHQLDTSPSCSVAFGAIDYPLRRKDLLTDGRIGGSKLMLMRGSDVIETVCEMIEDKPDVLLCTWGDCRTCSKSRQELRAAGRIE
ncbi:MAG: AAC(3) family N-acetyltransferase [Planctomycetota bacterium]|nr:AAC(3) family N-acetyltransferase [Planctomycetota bacterium]